jgi:hypothetical protein
MNVSYPQQNRTELPGWLVVPILLGSAAALLGGYWDDAWHTERGRDSFWIAPHAAIYAGVTASGAALAAWALLVARAAGVRAGLAHPPLLLAVVGVVATLGSAPIDNAWHEAFGRDAVVWSPPHVLGIAGTAALAAALCVELAARRGAGRRRLAVVAGGLLVAALGFAVVEYETDVPQFDEAWYLPVLATGALLGLGIARGALATPWAATRTAAVHLVLLALVGVALAALGYDAPLLPLLVAPAAALDLAARARARPLVKAGAAVGALYAVYVPYLALASRGVRLDAADVAAGLPVALLAGWAVLAALERATGGRRGAAGRPRSAPSAPTSAAALAVALALAAPAPGLAHDPGQGEDAGALDLAVVARGRAVELSAGRTGACPRLAPSAVVARRAGEALRGPLRRTGPCRFTGALRVPVEGRWFVYAELVAGRDHMESWLPVEVRDGHVVRAAERGRYAYEPPPAGTTAVEVAAGVALYGLVLALLAAIVALAGRAARRASRLR